MTLRRLREERLLSREAVAFRAAISPGALARIELAQSSPSWRTVLRIARALDVTVMELGDAIDQEGGSRSPGEPPGRKSSVLTANIHPKRLENPTAKRPEVSNHDMDTLVATAWKQGWWCERGASNYVKCYPPDGSRMIPIQSTPSNPRRARANKTAALRRAGLEI
jgi:transcriptional regulator with XRE-family HTH domain